MIHLLLFAAMLCISMMALEPLNGDPIKALIGNLQKNLIGRLTFDFWHLARCMMILRMRGVNRMVRTITRIFVRLGITGVDFSRFYNNIWMDTTNQAAQVFIVLAETCFDARKLKDAMLAASLGTKMVNNLGGNEPTPKESITRAYMELKSGNMIGKTIQLLDKVATSQRKPIPKLMDALCGAGGSPVWVGFITRRSLNRTANGKAGLECVARLLALGYKDIYQTIMDDFAMTHVIQDAALVEAQQKRAQSKNKGTRELIAADPNKLFANGRARVHTIVDRTNLTFEQTIRWIHYRIGKLDANVPLPDISFWQEEDGSYVLVAKIVTQLGAEFVAQVPVPKILPLSEKYSPGNAPYKAQLITAKEGKFICRPMLSCLHWGEGLLADKNEATPDAVARQLQMQAVDPFTNRPGSPLYMGGYMWRFAEAIALGWLEYQRWGDRKVSSRRVEAALRSAVSHMHIEMERYKSLRQLYVMGDECQIEWQCAAKHHTQLMQDADLIARLVIWPSLLAAGYDILLTSKSHPSDTAGYKGARRQSAWVSSLSPLADGSCLRRVLREIRACYAQAMTFCTPRAVGIVPERGVPQYMAEAQSWVLTCYADVEGFVHGGYAEPDVAGWQKTVEELTLLVETNPSMKDMLEKAKEELKKATSGEPQWEITSPDQAGVFPAGFKVLDAHEYTSQVIPVIDETEEMLRELYPEAEKISFVMRPLGAGYQRQAVVTTKTLRPGSGIGKATFSENVVKFMFRPILGVQWYAELFPGEKLVPIELLASAQSVVDKDGQAGIKHAVASSTMREGERWIIPDDASGRPDPAHPDDPTWIDGAFTAAISERLEKMGRDPSGNVRVFADLLGAEPRDVYATDIEMVPVGEFIVGYQTVIRTPHTDVIATKVKGIRCDVHVRHLGGIPFYTIKRHAVNINRFVALYDALAHPKVAPSEYDETTEEQLLIEGYTEEPYEAEFYPDEEEEAYYLEG